MERGSVLYRARVSQEFLDEAQYRRLRTKLGAPKAITAMAHKLARLVYRMLKYGQEYVDKGMQYYEDRYRCQQVERLRKRLQSSDSISSKSQRREGSFWRGREGSWLGAMREFNVVPRVSSQPAFLTTSLACVAVSVYLSWVISVSSWDLRDYSGCAAYPCGGGPRPQATLISDRLVRLCGFLDSRDGWDH